MTETGALIVALRGGGSRAMLDGRDDSLGVGVRAGGPLPVVPPYGARPQDRTNFGTVTGTAVPRPNLGGDRHGC